MSGLYGRESRGCSAGGCERRSFGVVLGLSGRGLGLQGLLPPLIPLRGSHPADCVFCGLTLEGTHPF